MAGGWNNAALTDSAFFSGDINKWTFFNGTGNTLTPLSLPLRSSVLVLI